MVGVGGFIPRRMTKGTISETVGKETGHCLIACLVQGRKERGGWLFRPLPCPSPARLSAVVLVPAGFVLPREMGGRRSDRPWQAHEKCVRLTQEGLKNTLECDEVFSFLTFILVTSSQAAVSAQATLDATPAQPTPSQSLNLAHVPGEEPPPAPNLVAQENRPINENVQMNAQGGPVLNEEDFNRDWLDWMYTFSRAAILLSIVYFYSSFSRFVMVMGAMLLVYL